MSLKFTEEAKAQHQRVSDSSLGLVDEFFKVPLPLWAARLMSQGCELANFRCLSLLVPQLRRDKSRINNYSMALRAASFIYLLLLVDKADSGKGKLPVREGKLLSLEQMGVLLSCSFYTRRGSWSRIAQRKLGVQCQRCSQLPRVSSNTLAS